MMDIAVHIGTLLSVLVYFRRDIMNMLFGLTNTKSSGFRLALHLVIASIPVIIAGFIIHKIEPSFVCMIEIMAWTMLGFGVVLWIADRFENRLALEQMRAPHALLIGLSQVLALIPGVSRSGITMTSARFLGFNRVEAARFSLLLSIVAISGAGVLTGFSLIETNDLSLGLDVLLAIFLSFLASWISIILMMKWLARASFTPFAIYRVILGVVLLILIYSDKL